LNDAHGHLAGDAALRACAEAIQRSLRQSDLLGRYGGEEFVAVLPNTTVEAARVLAERLRDAVRAAALPVDTGSVGVAELGEGRDTAEALIGAADAALYAAKRAEKNRVEIAGAPSTG